MVLRTVVDCTGSINIQWHMRQAVKDDKDAMLVRHNDSESRQDTVSKASTRMTRTRSVTSEV